MPTSYTQNYHLNQWEPGDKVLRTDFNADNARIDAALKAEADARTSADSAEALAREALEVQVAKLGNCQIWASTYVGEGTHGPDHPTRFTFPRRPMLAVIDNQSGTLALMMDRDGWFAAPNALNHLSWSGSTAIWYTNDAKDGQEYMQLNARDVTYRVVALIPMDR